jgi:hypothetical protein
MDVGVGARHGVCCEGVGAKNRRLGSAGGAAPEWRFFVGFKKRYWDQDVGPGRVGPGLGPGLGPKVGLGPGDSIHGEGLRLLAQTGVAAKGRTGKRVAAATRPDKHARVATTEECAVAAEVARSMKQGTALVQVSLSNLADG